MSAGSAAARRGWSAHRGLVALAVGYQWVYNGANFLAFKVAGEALHPLVVAALRFSIAAAVLSPFAIARWRRTPASATELGSAAGLGLVMLAASQALAIWSAHLLPAGTAAVFGSSAPLFLALFAWGLLHRPPTRRQGAGVLLGAGGLLLMGWGSASAGGFRPAGAALALVASASWAAGSLLAPRLRPPRDPVVGFAAQLLAAALALDAVVAASGLAGATDLTTVPASAWGALAFLVTASTLVGYAVFLAVNAEVSPTLANTFNYAAPVIALGLSALWLHERLTPAKLLAGAVTLAGVALMIDRDPRRGREAGAADGG